MKEQNKILESLPAGFFKQFKTGEDFTGFMDALFKRGVEELLDGELDAHLGYEKHSPSLGVIVLMFQGIEKAVLSHILYLSESG